MSRAQLILDLLNKEDVAVQETLRQNEAEKSFEVDDLFQNVGCCESAPQSVVFSPKYIDPSAIKPPLSVPMVMDTTDDNLITVEHPFLENYTSVKRLYSKLDPQVVSSAHSEAMEIDDQLTTVDENDAVSKSPSSNISGIEPLGSSPVRDFSDSSVSWYPDSDEKRCLKRKIQVIRLSSSDSSDSDDLACAKRKKKNSKRNQLVSSDQPGHSKEHYDTNISSNSIAIRPTKECDGNQHSTVSTNYSENNDHATIETEESDVQQNSILASNATMANNKTDSKRWKKSDPSKWKKNQAKNNKQNCLPYQGKKGNTMLAKKPKPVKCDLKCRYLCLSSFSEEERTKLCEDYWKIKDYGAQKQFLLHLIISKSTKTLKAGIPDNKHRCASYEYYFNKNGTKVRVCKEFFLKTLCISNGPVNEALKNRNEFGNFTGKDGRGSRDPINKTSPESEQTIINHINSFPRMESHYCRKKTQRQYLDSKLSITKMYELYKEKLASTVDEPSSFYVYKRIFGSKFNLSFFTPKKDLCMICTRFDSSGRPENLKEEYDAHIGRKNAAQAAKAFDKQRSINDETYLVVTADMQSTLHIPVCGVGILYYTRKLNVQNYTIHTAKPPNEAFCITWNEVNGKRGSVEIASAINWWISKVPSTIKEITIYSDTCAGQNRNQFITAFLIHLIQRPDLHLDVLEQKYLESGHTHMEVDSMHSAIERQQRNTPVYSMIDWKSIMCRARSKRHRESAPPYVVKELTYDEMLDVRAINEKFVRNTSKDEDGKKIMWLKIKCLRFEKQLPGIVKFRYTHEGPYSKFNVFQTNEKVVPRTRTRRRLQEGHEMEESDFEGRNRDLISQLKSFDIPKAYSAPLPISEAKKKDLLGLCRKGIVPQELHAWYESLPTSKDVIDRLLVPDVTEQSEDA